MREGMESFFNPNEQPKATPESWGVMSIKATLESLASKYPELQGSGFMQKLGMQIANKLGSNPEYAHLQKIRLGQEDREDVERFILNSFEQTDIGLLPKQTNLDSLSEHTATDLLDFFALKRSKPEEGNQQ